MHAESLRRARCKPGAGHRAPGARGAAQSPDNAAPRCGTLEGHWSTWRKLMPSIRTPRSRHPHSVLSPRQIELLRDDPDAPELMAFRLDGLWAELGEGIT